MTTVLRATVLAATLVTASQSPAGAAAPQAVRAKAAIRFDSPAKAENLLKPDAWRGWQQGYTREGDTLICDNGDDAKAQRGAGQTVVLNQKTPQPIVARAWSKAEGVTGSADNNYAVYLDLSLADGTSLWGQAAPFAIGTHDWFPRQVVVIPEKPVRAVSFYVLLRGHAGRAMFRDALLTELNVPPPLCLFDGRAVRPEGEPAEGFQVRDVKLDSDFFRIDGEAADLKLDCRRTEQQGATLLDVTLSSTRPGDRAVTLYYTVPVGGESLRWLDDPRRSTPVEPRREYVSAGNFRVGANGRLSRYPLGAVANGKQGVALGIDMSRPAFYRVGYNAGTGELFLAYDLALTAEKPTAEVRLCRFAFEPAWGFRAALARYYEIFPDQFRCRTPQQGLWMPFAKISEVEGFEDFAFKFKEGNNETAWDDAHGMLTFRYTEPMTWWMRMPAEMPRTPEAAEAEARRLADQRGDLRAKSLFTSGFRDAAGRLAGRFRDTPWCNGIAWSMNSMPGIRGEVTDFKLKWNPEIRQKLYGPERTGDLDGEYIDSSEGYMTEELDFSRDHFAAARTPLCYSIGDRQPGIFKGLVVFEYVRGIADDVHAMGKLMMANGAPTRLCWLAPMLEVMGTETDWNPGGRWRPMSDAELLYRRALCKGKPYCFLMNTRFEDFPPALVEKYMKRCLAYGMFPGFFSHNASQGHYFTRPELYNRDRPLFKKYVPLCKLVAEAGWEPITLARSNDERVYVERFGRKYLTVLNDGPDRRSVTIRIEPDLGRPASVRELLSGKAVPSPGGQVRLDLGGEDVAVVELP